VEFWERLKFTGVRNSRRRKTLVQCEGQVRDLSVVKEYKKIIRKIV